MRNKLKLIAFLTAAATVFPVFAASAAPFEVTRRTLVVWAGDRKVILEAPQTMCFVDRTHPAEDLLFRALETMIPPDNKLLAFFADCNQLANWGGPSSAGNALKRGGYISWRYPEVAKTVDIPITDYLDVVEPTFNQSVIARKQYAYGGSGQQSMSGGGARVSSSQPDPDLIEFTEDPRRSETAVYTAYRIRTEIFGEEVYTNDVEATTVLNGVPVFISYGESSKKVMDDSADSEDGAMNTDGMSNAELLFASQDRPLPPLETAYGMIDALTRNLVRINE